MQGAHYGQEERGLDVGVRGSGLKSLGRMSCVSASLRAGGLGGVRGVAGMGGVGE